jgi:hypothetical protein
MMLAAKEVIMARMEENFMTFNYTLKIAMGFMV